MAHSQRTIDAFAVTDFVIGVLIVASIAKVSSAKAMKESDGAAEVAFPIDLCCAVFLALFHASACKSLDLTAFAA